MMAILSPHPPSRYPRALVSSRKANLGNGAPKEGPLRVLKCPVRNPQRADFGIGIQEPMLNLFCTEKTNAGRNIKKKKNSRFLESILGKGTRELNPLSPRSAKGPARMGEGKTPCCLSPALLPHPRPPPSALRPPPPAEVRPQGSPAAEVTVAEQLT